MTQTSSTQAHSTCRLAGFSPKFYFVCKWQYFGAKITTLMVTTCGVSLSTMNYHLLTFNWNFFHTAVSTSDAEKFIYSSSFFQKKSFYIFFRELKPVSGLDWDGLDVQSWGWYSRPLCGNEGRWNRADVLGRLGGMVSRRIKMFFCTVLLADIPPSTVVRLHHIAIAAILPPAQGRRLSWRENTVR